MFLREVFALGLLHLAATADASAAADTSARSATAEAENAGDFGWFYIIAALMLAVGAMVAKEVLDGRCRRRQSVGEGQDIAEESLLEAGGVPAEAAEVATAVRPPLPSLLAGTAAGNGADTTRAAKSATAGVATADVVVNGGE